MDIVDRIKKLADRQGMTLKELALKLGFGENSIYRWNKNRPTLNNVEKVADYFNVSTDYLLGRQTNDVNNELDDDSFGNDLISHFRLNTANMETEDIEALEEELKEYTDFLIERAKKKKRN